MEVGLRKGPLGELPGSKKETSPPHVLTLALSENLYRSIAIGGK